MLNLEQKIEFIREKVIMANNPECKTYEEALDMEARIVGCLVETITSPFAEQYRKAEIATILWDDGEDSAGNERYFCYRNDVTFTTVKKNLKILGLPLTFERILFALNYYVGSVESGWYGLTKNAIFKSRFMYFKNTENYKAVYEADYIIYTDENKTLESQSQETIEKIYELLNND